MKNHILSIIAILLVVSSCKKNRGTIEQTYSKAIAQYENVNFLRKTGIYAPARNVVNTGKIFYGDNLILLGEKNEGIHVIDNTDPNNPVPISFLDLPYTNEFYVHNNIIYAVSHYDLVKIDISDMANPILVSRLNNAFGPFVKDASGNVLIGFKFETVTESFKLGSEEEKSLRENNTLYFDYQEQVIPFSQVPSSFIGSSVENKGTMNRIAYSNNTLFVIGKDDIHTFTDNGTQLTRGTNNVIGNDLETVYINDNRLLVGTNSEMIILTNNVSPQVLSTYRHVVTCDPVLPYNDLAYLTLRSTNENGCNGNLNILEVVDISVITNPVQVTTINMASPYGMAIMNDYLFVAEGINGLSVMDISTPSAPVLFAEFRNIEAFDVLKHPNVNNGILITGTNGLKQYSFDSSAGTLQELSNIVAP